MHIKSIYNRWRSSSPKNNKEKGDIFENFVGDLIDLIPGLNFARKNVLTETSEVDLHFDIGKEIEELYPIKGKVAVVECKDVDRKINVKDISHIVCELLERKITFGGFVANNYFTENAKNRVFHFYKSHNLTIFLIDKDDLENIYNQTNNIEKLLYHRIIEELQFR
ncbi:MAG: hypothetical protein HeimC2_28300 [Candidatus Heimdallarchaeota archaeon LC_2]|nr:MAG: hypothetical protein HeimC2_28300 [Candidatus Heimdallarchaeota archaeon LC_2]